MKFRRPVALALALMFGLTAATLAEGGGPGSGGPQTGNSQNTGTVTVPGTTPERPARQGWAAFMMRIHADGLVSQAEKREVIRYLGRAPLPLRSRLLQSWFGLKMQIGGNTNPAVVSGIVTRWLLADRGAATAWLDSLPGRGR